MPSTLEAEFHEAMLNVYRRAKGEAGYKATLFLKMVTEQGAYRRRERSSIRALFQAAIRHFGNEGGWISQSRL